MAMAIYVTKDYTISMSEASVKRISNGDPVEVDTTGIEGSGTVRVQEQTLAYNILQSNKVGARDVWVLAPSFLLFVDDQRNYDVMFFLPNEATRRPKPHCFPSSSIVACFRYIVGYVG